MNGLGKYELLPVEAKIKASLEHAIQETQVHGTGTHQWCMHCLASTYRRPIFSACRRCCPHEVSRSITGYLAKTNGAYTAQRFCLDCAYRTNLSRGEVTAILDLCLRDNTRNYTVHPCTRCGTDAGTELHHWAPRAIFNDADSWPVSWLCLDCHRTWHQAMRAAGGHRLPEDQRIGDLPDYYSFGATA